MKLPDLEAWAIFARIAATGSFAGAAAELGLSTATVSKAIKRLELRTGERLLHRSARRLSLTETGRVLAVRAARILEEGEAVEAEAQATSAAPRGRVRLAAPMSFGLRHVAPILPAFMQAYPEISVDLQLDDRVVDIVAGGIDVALRIAELPDSSLVARRLRPVKGLLLAAPAYVASHAMPRRPSDLRDHPCLTYSYLASGRSWRFLDAAGQEASVVARGPLSATNGDALCFALEAGLGIGLLPDFLVWESVAAGRLVTVMPDWRPVATAIHLVTPAGGPRPPRVSVLLDFLARRFGSDAAPWSDGRA